jgi:hypothetical protein
MMSMSMHGVSSSRVCRYHELGAYLYVEENFEMVDQEGFMTLIEAQVVSNRLLYLNSDFRLPRSSPRASSTASSTASPNHPPAGSAPATGTADPHTLREKRVVEKADTSNTIVLSYSFCCCHSYSVFRTSPVDILISII